MSKLLYGDEIDNQHSDTCTTPVPDIWPKVTRDRCRPVRPCCPPRTRARDAIRIDPSEAGRCFGFTPRATCGEGYKHQVVDRYYRLDIREKGYCDVLMCIPPTRATETGAICFDWPDEFKSLPSGYYEGDVYIDGCLCTTLLFWIPTCMTVSKPETVTYDNICHSCKCGSKPCRCGMTCCDTIPMVDEEIFEAEAIGCVEDCDQC